MKITGDRRCLGRATDHEGTVLQCCVSKRRDKRTAHKFLTKAMKGYGQPALSKVARFAGTCRGSMVRFNHFNHERSLSIRDQFKLKRTSACTGWRGHCAS